MSSHYFGVVLFPWGAVFVCLQLCIFYVPVLCWGQPVGGCGAPCDPAHNSLCFLSKLNGRVPALFFQENVVLTENIKHSNWAWNFLSMTSIFNFQNLTSIAILKKKYSCFACSFIILHATRTFDKDRKLLGCNSYIMHCTILASENHL